MPVGSRLLPNQNGKGTGVTDYGVAMLNFCRDTDLLQVRPDAMWETGSWKLRSAEAGLSERNPYRVRTHRGTTVGSYTR